MLTIRGLESAWTMTPPLAIDIDGTMTRPDGGVDPRLFDPLRDWDAPVVVATGKSFPYPVALCQFVGVPPRVVAENGGVVLIDDRLVLDGDGGAARRVADDLRDLGHPGGWASPDLHNRWRETELSVDRNVPRGDLEAVAAEHGQVVVDTGYSFHVKSEEVTKATGLQHAAELLSVDASSFVAIGDSANDAELFEVVEEAYAVANAADVAKRRADVVTDAAFGAGVLEALDRIR